ncbi:MAG: pirin family protein [Pseudomonadota bacterium]
MMFIRPGEARGKANFGWLDSRHSFSFGQYFDPAHMGFGPLRVINEDRVKPGQGFGTHGHKDMEILSFVLEGALEHKDNMGNGSIIRPGDLQRMTAGKGVLHSEYNASQSDDVHFLQIWIVPETQGLEPGYEQLSFPLEERRNQLRLIGSRDGRDGSVTVHQDVNLYTGIIDAGETVSFTTRENRGIWVQVTRGALKLGDTDLVAGDGVALEGAQDLSLNALEDAEVLLFDMAAAGGTTH